MKFIVAVITTFLFVPILHAQQAKFTDNMYIGIGYADSTVDISSIEVNALHPTEGSNPATVGKIHKSSGGMRVYGGWQVAPNINLEIGFADVGQISYSGSVAADSGTYNETIGISAATMAFSAVMPITDSQHLILKVGGHSTVSSSTYTYSGTSNSYSTVKTTTNSGAIIGMGYEYIFNKRLGVRAEWEKMFSMVGPNAWDADFTGIAFTYHY